MNPLSVPAPMRRPVKDRDEGAGKNIEFGKGGFWSADRPGQWRAKAFPSDSSRMNDHVIENIVILQDGHEAVWDEVSNARIRIII
jgi:hypothetical protein